MADLLVPVSIRPKGKLEKLLAETEKNIYPDFRIDYAAPLIKPPKYDFGNAIFDEERWDYITHWTRTHHGPWPGESHYDFYSRLVNSRSRYPNSAVNTLKNMMAKKKIYASSKRIRKSIRCIGFSDLEPKSMLKWMRWLPKRVNWNFEPYELGIKQVIYGHDDTYDGLPENLKPYFQSRGTKDVDWSEENEWRHIGDLDLSKIPPEDLIFLIWREGEADLLKKITAGEVVALSVD
jgi:hypothetical protein